MLLEEEGESGEKEDVKVRSGHKTTLEEICSDKGTPVRKKIVGEEFKIILKFKEEEENRQIGPITLSRELKKKIGHISFAKTLRDGSVMIICKTEEQKNKTLSIESICGKKCERKINCWRKENNEGSDNRNTCK